MYLEGDRVRLRPRAVEDAPAYQRWVNDVEIARLLGGPLYQWSVAAEEDTIRTQWAVNDWEHGINLAIEAVDRAKPALIGTISLRELDAVARWGEVGIMIGERSDWNRGYGEDAMRTLCRYAFEDLDLNRIELYTFEYNPRAVRSYEKVGFVLEGRLRQRRYAAGRYYDTLVMGLLRGEFEVREAARLASAEASSE
jgi:RimJ/RimL family protein N-acetyltransferase